MTWFVSHLPAPPPVELAPPAPPVKVPVIIPTVLGSYVIDHCVEHVYASEQVEPDVLVVDNGRNVTADQFLPHAPTIYRPEDNLGVSASWNYGCRWAWERGFDLCVILNDDINLALPLILRALVDAARANPRAVVEVAHCKMSAFVLAREVWDDVGEFDEGFWPGYYEDSDYQHRMRLHGIATVSVGAKAVRHHGSATVQLDKEMEKVNTFCHRRNHERFRLKWGGEPGHETYDRAWNGGEPAMAVRTQWLARKK